MKARVLSVEIKCLGTRHRTGKLTLIWSTVPPHCPVTREESRYPYSMPRNPSRKVMLLSISSFSKVCDRGSLIVRVLCAERAFSVQRVLYGRARAAKLRKILRKSLSVKRGDWYEVRDH